MKPELEKPLRSFLLEFLVYSGLVAAYYFLVLHLLGGWLHHLFKHNPDWYAGVALALILAQGFLLDLLTSFLLGSIRSRTED